MLFLRSALTLQNYALKLFKNWELLISVIDLSIGLLFGNQKTSLFEPFKFSLDVASIFLYKLSQSTNVRPKIRILGINNNYLAPDS